MDLLLQAIQDVWSTQPELKMTKVIQEASALPGLSEKLIKNIDKWVRISSGVYSDGTPEAMFFLWRPRVQVRVAVLRDRLLEKNRELYDPPLSNWMWPYNWTEEPVKNRWKTVPIYVNEPELRNLTQKVIDEFMTADLAELESFTGSTVEAVVHWHEKLDALQCSTAGFSDMIPHREMIKNYDFSP